jgi:uncharacterized membrane protein
MSDLYVEYSTGKIPVPRIRFIFRNLLVAAGILFIIYSVLFIPILWTVSILFFVLAYYYNRGNKYEYEYILLDDRLQIDKVIADIKRKKKYRGSLEYLEIFTNDKSKIDEIKAQSKKRIKQKYYANPKKEVWAMVLRTDEGLHILYMNADENLVQSLRRKYPRQVIIKPGEKHV